MGGADTRLWLLSRKAYPKQFADVIDGTSLFQRAATPVQGDDFAAPAIVTGNPFRPLGAVHRLENPGKIPVEMIEVQTGLYLGEDDIIRYEDRYARQ